MKPFLTVYLKECVDNFRDRRTIISSFSLALMGPLLFVGLMTFMLQKTLGERDDAIHFAVVGGENAPTLMQRLAAANANAEPITLADDADPRTLVTSGNHDLVLLIPDDYATRQSRGERVTLTLVYDSSELGSASRRARILEGQIEAYSRIIGLLRLQLRGIDPGLVQPISVQRLDVASNAEKALMVLSMVPYFILLVAFMGGFYLAIDTTAGEREHGSLEPLLSQPISRAALVLGKIAATCTFAGASLLLLLAGFYVGLPLVPLERIGLSLGFTAGNCLLIFLVMLPMIWLAAALLTVVASMARTYKEAQTYLSFLVLVPTLPIMFTQLMSLEPTPWMMLLPSLSQSFLISDFMTDDAVAIRDVALSIGSTGLLAALLTRLAISIYQRERILG
ncbi:MAG: ABC transporter permease [Pseudomonadales bacterium]